MLPRRPVVIFRWALVNTAWDPSLRPDCDRVEVCPACGSLRVVHIGDPQRKTARHVCIDCPCDVQGECAWREET